MRDSRSRILLSAVVALVAVCGTWVALSLSSTLATRIVAVLSPVAGTVVFALLCRSRPHWGFGLGFAALQAIVAWVWRMIVALQGENGGEGAELWPATYLGIYAAGIVFLAGAIGAWIAALVVQALEPRPWGSHPRRVRPWQVGLGVSVLFILTAVVLAAISA